MSTSRAKVTAESLSHAVEFDCPFRVNEDGTISREKGLYAPEACYGELIRDGDRSRYAYPFPEDDRWELISGFSGQDRYSGPVMHNSEYLGGAMAQYVLDNPGVYVIMAVYWTAEEDEDAPTCAECSLRHCASTSCPEDTIEGWVLARYKGDA